MACYRANFTYFIHCTVDTGWCIGFCTCKGDDEFPSGLRPESLLPLACWGCGFETRRDRDVCLSVVSVVCCQVSATGRSLIQRGPTDCGVLLCVIKKHQECAALARVGLLRQKRKEVDAGTRCKGNSCVFFTCICSCVKDRFVYLTKW